jgi:hypothetical protein
MTPVFLDFETFWSTDHSLSKMSPITYVLHPRTEIQSVSVKVGMQGETHVYFGVAEIQKAFAEIDWKDAWVIAHNNSEFDALVLAWRFGIRPKMWGCTMAMARPVFAKTVGVSLKALMQELKCPFQKGSLEEVNTKGKLLADFTPEEIEKMRVYNGIDTEGCAYIFKKLVRMIPQEELEVIDMTVRMLVEPEFEADVPLLEQTLAEEKRRKAQALMDIATLSGAYKPGMDEDEALESARKMLASANKFAQYLKDLGVIPPMKPSPSNPNKEVYALAKTDPQFIALQDHRDPLVAAAAQARLGVKSTQLETRTEKLLEAASYCNGLLPIPLKYCGADTTWRWSGFIYNPQNFPRINPDKPKLSDALRHSLRAPKGKKIVVADLSGIELRVNMFLWKVPYAMKLFQDDPENADLYRYFAAHELYLIPESEITKAMRQIGKVSHLGLGFGAAAPTFQAVAKILGGVDMPLDIDLERPDAITATQVVNRYRTAHPEIVKGWRTCQRALDSIILGEEVTIDPWGLCTTCSEGIKTPKGMIRYPNLRKREIVDKEGEPTGKFEYVYGEGRHLARIYGGKVVENIVQHLARCALTDMMLKVRKLTGRRAKHTVHDELVYIVDENLAEAHLETVQSVMRSGVDWWPELITWSEGSCGDTYGEAK